MVNEVTIADMHSNYGGLLNAGFSGRISPDRLQFSKKTGVSLIYHLGTKVINGVDSTTNTNLNFFNGAGNFGLYFQTGAFSEKSEGRVWLQLSLSSLFSPEEEVRRLFGDDFSTNSYGFNAEFGLVISGEIDLRGGYYKYLNQEKIAGFEDGIFRFAVNFHR